MISKEQPAFPETHIHHWRGKDPEVGETDNVVPRWNGGLTKREYFASSALRGLVANPKISEDIIKHGGDSAFGGSMTCAVAVKLADLLIEELAKK